MTTPSDEAARERALDPARSFIVQAPAGSGKTELLTQRMLALLATVERPEEILAITFTRKAAAEMRGRLLEALELARTPAPSEPHRHRTWRLARAVDARAAARMWQITEQPARLRVMTIDALCAALARQLPIDSGLGAPPRVVEDPFKAYLEAARNTIAVLDEPGPWAPAVATLLRHLDNDRAKVANLLAEMLGRRDQWLRHVAQTGAVRSGRVDGALRPAVEGALVSLIEDTLGAFAARLADAQLLEPLVDLCRFAAEHRAEDDPLATWVAWTQSGDYPTRCPAQGLAGWRALANVLLTGAGEWRKRMSVREGFPAPGSASDPAEKARLKTHKESMLSLLGSLARVPGLLQQVRRLRDLPEASYDDDGWSVVEAVLTVLPRCAAELTVVFQRTGEADFVALAQAAQEALGHEDAPTDLTLRLDEQISHVLVDEFQDTSFSQFALLRGLTMGWQPGDGRSLFLVGDPMQSIYRFREADVALYLRAWRAGIGGRALERLQLKTNFRSTAGVVAWVNETFAELFPDESDETDGAVAFSASEAVAADQDSQAVTLDAFVDVAPEVEAAATADWVARARAEHPARSIAVLIQARTQFAPLLEAFRARSIPCQAIDIEPLRNRPVIGDLMALTRAWLNLADRLAWLTVLRAPWCGLRLSDLLRLGGGDPAPEASQRMPAPMPTGEAVQNELPLAPDTEPHSVAGAARDRWPRTVWDALHDQDRLGALSSDGQRRAERLRGVLARHWPQRGRCTIREQIEALWFGLAGPACTVDDDGLADAQTFFDVLDDMGQGGTLDDLALLERQLTRQYAQVNALGATDATTEPERPVQVMTIHKAKGLEFDAVVLPGLGRGRPRREPRLLAWMERSRDASDADLLLAPIKAAGGDHDPLYRYIEALDAAREDQEQRRLLYVAATRARHRLHLLATARADPSGPPGACKPVSASLLKLLWPLVSERFDHAVRGEGQVPSDSHARNGDEAPHVGRDGAVASGFRRLALDWYPPPPPEPVPGVARSPGAISGDEDPAFDWAGPGARHIGIVVHALLCRLAQSAPSRWPQGELEALRPSVAARLRARGFPADSLAVGIDTVLKAVRAALDDPIGRWILSAHEHAASELALRGLLGRERVGVVIDRTFVDERGRRWIIDFKTSVHEGGDREAFLDREQQRYSAQLGRYAQLMARYDPGRPIELGLYFPLLNGWRQWR